MGGDEECQSGPKEKEYERHGGQAVKRLTDNSETLTLDDVRTILAEGLSSLGLYLELLS